MALYKRKGTWWVDIAHQGKRVRRSTGTQIKLDAQRFHDKLKMNLWSKKHENAEPQRFWVDATLRWLKESSHKRSLDMDRSLLLSMTEIVVPA